MLIKATLYTKLILHRGNEVRVRIRSESSQPPPIPDLYMTSP